MKSKKLQKSLKFNIEYRDFFLSTMALGLIDLKNKKGTVLSLDCGKKKIGVAVGNNQIYTTEKVTTLISKTEQQRLELIEKLVKKWEPIYLVIGLPKNMDGTANEMTRFCLNLSRKIKHRCSIEIILIDERLSSIEAENLLKNEAGVKINKINKSLIDQEAAQIILRNHFEELAYEKN